MLIFRLCDGSRVSDGSSELKEDTPDGSLVMVHKVI